MPVPQAVRIMALPTIISQLFILNHFIGMYGIVWSQVTADILTVTLSRGIDPRPFCVRSHMIAGGFKVMHNIQSQNIAFYSNTKKNDRNQPPFGVK